MLNYTLHQNEHDLSIHFRGAVDERAIKVLAELESRLRSSSEVVLDMQMVDSFNSLGARAWAGFIKTASEGRALSYAHCPADFLNEVNMLPILAHSVAILSFSAEFICPDCHHSTRESFDARLSKEVLLSQFERVTCTQCLGPMFPDIDPDSILYFKNPVS